MFHSGYVEKMKRKIMQREKGKHKSRIPPCEGGEIKRGQIFNSGFVETLSHCFFLGALFKFTIEKIVYSVLLLILYSRKNNNRGQLNDKMNTQKITYEFA